MGCDPKAVARMMRNRAEHPESAAYWNDQIIDATTRATEWDADGWGFDPTRWMAVQRAEMERRIRACTRQGSR